MPIEVIIDGVRYVPAAEEPAVIRAKPCRSCGATAEGCEAHVRKHGRGCCGPCYRTDTHGMSLDDWLAFRTAYEGAGLLSQESDPQPSGLGSGQPPTQDGPDGGEA